MTSTLWATPPQNFSIEEKSHISLFNTLGLWVKRPSLEVPTAVGEDGGEHDSSPRNLEGRGKNCTGNITSLAKVPRKCQNKMCWLRFGDEKSIPGVPEANPSTSQHPSQAEELVTCQFSSAPWTAPPESPCRSPALMYHALGLAPLPKEGTASPQPFSSGTYHLVQGRRVTGKEHSHTALGAHLCCGRTLPASVGLDFHS